MKAIGSYILVERIDAKNKEVNGLLYTEKLDVDNRYVKGRIMSCGCNVAILKAEDIIYYDRNRTDTITHENNTYYVIKDVDVVLCE
jgi:co-chaperonin GroES (HSP10)|tara:strand:- start:155 stop:412 length:258 start_codon:yes stop_codon:yes gene_type:complete